LRIAGRFSESVAAYRRSAEIRPEFGTPWFSLANLKTFRFTPEDIDAMKAQLARTDLDNEDRLQFEFALGKALEDAADYAASFESLLSRQCSAASRSRLFRRLHYARGPTNDCSLQHRVLKCAQGLGCPAADPIFIIGLPRAGSTLIEQILASHSQVEGTRELPDVPGFALELGSLERPGKPANLSSIGGTSVA